jgi:hypothetical protein
MLDSFQDWNIINTSTTQLELKMYTYKHITANFYAISKNGKAYKAVFSEAHAKMFCNSLNNA